MQELIPLDRAYFEQLGIDLEKLFKRRFKPVCWYNKPLDWFFYLSRDCSYVATRTEDPHIELLKHRSDIVGMKIMWFSELPRDLRSRFIEATHVDPDSITGIEDIWLLNTKEMLPEMYAAQSAFFKELLRREARSRYDALHSQGFPMVRASQRHERIMQHLRALKPERLPV